MRNQFQVNDQRSNHCRCHPDIEQKADTEGHHSRLVGLGGIRKEARVRTAASFVAEAEIVQVRGSADDDQDELGLIRAVDHERSVANQDESIQRVKNNEPAVSLSSYLTFASAFFLTDRNSFQFHQPLLPLCV